MSQRPRPLTIAMYPRRYHDTGRTLTPLAVRTAAGNTIAGVVRIRESGTRGYGHSCARCRRRHFRPVQTFDHCGAIDNEASVEPRAS